MNQNRPKWWIANSEPATAIHDQFFLYMSTIRQVSAIPLLTEEALFTWENFEDEFYFLNIYKSSR